MNKKDAVAAINRAGALLVFPLDNKKEPASIWSHFYPRTPMRWEWDEGGDNRVADLWHLRSELSTTGQVVYTKWFRGRATYFSKPLFAALLCALNRGTESDARAGLSSEARAILSVLESESPLSTKEIKRMADLRGRAYEATYEKALKELWSRLLIVAYGEVDDGAFPSLAVGSTRVLFEDLWQKAFTTDFQDAEGEIARALPSGDLFYKHFLKLKSAVPSRQVSEKKKSASPSVPGVVDFGSLKRR